jgi:hypothetical protein
MQRLVATAITFVLLAFICFFVDGMFEGHDLALHLFCALIACALSCGVIMSAHAVITGKDPF